MKKIHNSFRNNWSWYRQWHNFKYSTHIHFILLFGLIFVISGIYVLKLDFVSQKKDSNIVASSGNNTLTTQANWQAGINDNTDLTTSLGGVLAETSETLISYTGATVTASENESTKLNFIDGNEPVTYTDNSGLGNWWKVDLGSNKNLSRFASSTESGVMAIVNYYYSTDDIAYSVLTPGNCSLSLTYPVCEWAGTPVQARYFKFVGSGDDGDPKVDDEGAQLYELFLYEIASATHTSSPTQIGDVSSDPGRYVVEYNGFDTTETEPANTAIDYRFQLVNSSGVSTDGWTAWALGDVADLATTYPSQLTLSQTKIDAGETYLQVQSRLTTTDGVSTPTLSDYTASYHTNKAPNTPTPQ